MVAYICPHCGNDGTSAEINITVTTTIAYTGPGHGFSADPLEPLPGDECRCCACGYEERVAQFTPKSVVDKM